MLTTCVEVLTRRALDAFKAVIYPLLLLICQVKLRGSNMTTAPPPQLPPNEKAIDLWYKEVLLSREQVLATLDELRSRSGMFLTVVALTTTFFATLATRSSTPIRSHPVELAALALFFVVVLALATVLAPAWQWSSFARPGRVRRKVLAYPRLSVPEVQAAIARRIPRDVRADRERIKMFNGSSSLPCLRLWAKFSVGRLPFWTELSASGVGLAGKSIAAATN